MKDKSKKLLVINTNKKPSPAQSSAQSSGGTPYGGGFGGVAFDMSDYLLKAVWDRVWEIKTDSQGNEYIFSKLPVVTQYGITMYADGGELNLPSIFEGLPFDNQTIWLNPETGVIEVIGGTGGGSIDSIHWNNIEGKPSFAAVATSGKYADLSEKPDLTKYALQSEIPSLSGYATEKWVTDKNYLDSTKLSDELAKYVTIDEDETINGVKDFANGLMIDGLGITKLQDDVVYLDAHLVVRGGITMFGTGEDVDVPTIMDALSVDGVNLQVVNGVLTFVGETTGGVADSVRWDNVIGRPTLLSSFTDDVVSGKYLPLSGGTLTGSGNDILVINRTDGVPYIRFMNNGAGLAYFGVNTSKEMVFIPQNSAEILKVLHSGNYSDYALPLSGGTLTGSLIMDSTKGYYEALPGGAILGYSNDSTKISGAISTGCNFVGSPTYPTVIRSTGTLKHYRADLTYSYDILDSYNTDYMGNFDIDASALSTSNFYPVIFNANAKPLVVRMYSIGGKTSVAYNRNDLEFTFRGQGWTDVPHNLTVHHYNCYTATETTIGCIGMGLEGGAKVVWVRGGLKYKIYSNQRPYLKTANYTDGNQIFTVGTSFSGGTNTKVILYWTPQTTSGIGALYHSSSVAVGSNLSVASNANIKGTLTTTGLATFNGGLTTSIGTFARVNTPYVNWRNNLGALLSTAGWYRFAVATVANNSGGNVILTIRRNYYNTDNEAYTLMANIDFGGCNWTQLGGSYRTQLITMVRCTYDNNGSMYFDFYYTGTAQNDVYVNCIGDAYCQTPTLVTSTLAISNQINLTNGYKMGSKNAYQMTLYRNATNGGSYIMYGANNQLTKSWAAGSDGQHRFGWYYKDIGAGTDVEKMWLDSNAVLNFETGINGRRMTIEGKSGANCFYATTDGAGWTMGNYYYTNAGSILGGISAYGQGDNFQYYFIGKAYNDTNALKFYNNGNVASAYWMISNTLTNPYLLLNNNGVHWIVQGYNGYMYLGAGVAKSLRIDSNGNCLSAGGITMYSDQRKKTILNHVELSLKQIADAPLIEHYYNSDESKTTHVGSIAQYWADLNDWFCKKDNEGFYTMEIQNAALASAISIARELQRYESKTDKKIRLLKKRIGELEEEIEKIKSA